MTWRVPVSTQDPVRTIPLNLAPPADLRVYTYVSGLPLVVNVGELVGTRRGMRIRSIYAEFDNSAGIATESGFDIFYRRNNENLEMAVLSFPVPANGFLFVNYFIGATTVQVYTQEVDDLDFWHCNLPDIILDDNFSIMFYINGPAATYYMMYEVFDL